jgi:CheY-like chemotaxis protein/two-component sensor histidine kinase
MQAYRKDTDFSKIEADKLEMELTDFNMEKVLSNLSDLISIKAEEKGLELVFGIENDVPSHLIGDPFRLGQVLTNLCSNAVKFTKKGQVVVKVEKVNPYRQNSKNNIMLRFVVKDTGIGIKQEQISSLFKPFHQADNSITRKYGGTGLGLAICKSLVEMMGGDISVTSEYGKGTTFAFTARFGIGKKPQKKHHIRPDELKDENIVNFHEIKGARILLVEDHEINQQIVVELLHNAGVDVTVAPNGLKAVEMLHRKDSENSFDAILMDLQMPEMDGYEATRQIREELKRGDLPIRFCLPSWPDSTLKPASSALQEIKSSIRNYYVILPKNIMIWPEKYKKPLK